MLADCYACTVVSLVVANRYAGLQGDMVLRALAGLATASATLAYRLLSRSSTGSFFGT
jgi:hypothetical protein